MASCGFGSLELSMPGLRALIEPFLSRQEVCQEAEGLLSRLRGWKASGYDFCVEPFWSVSGHDVREKVEGLLSRLRRWKVSGHEAPEEMEALLSLWKELDGVRAYFILFFTLPTFTCGLSKLQSGLSDWQFAVKALLSEWVSKLIADRVSVFNESALSEAVKQAENLVSKFRVWITNFVKGLVSLFEKIRFNLKQTRKPSYLKGTVGNDRVEVRLEGVHGGGGREEIMGGGRVVSAIPGIINRARNKGIGGGTGGEGNGDEDRGRGRDVEDRRGEGNASPKMDSSRKAEIYTDRVCDPAPHIRLHTIPFGISQASGSGSPVEGQGESSGGQDGGSGARSQGEGSDGGIGGEGDGDEGIGGGIGGGGQGEGNGDEGGEEGRGRVGDVEIGRRVRNARPTTLAEIFLALSAQSTAAAIALHFLGLSSGDRGLLVSVLVINLMGYVLCTAAIWQSHTSPRASRILGRIGSAATSLGFILMIAMILPSYLLWMIVLACLVLLAVFIYSFMS